jgi:hypothetical protein
MAILILDAVAEYLESQGLGTRGQDLFVFHMPEGVNAGILVIADNDMATEVDEYIPKLKKSRFRVIVRHADYQSAVTLAYQVRNALDLHRATVGGISVLRLRSAYDPIAYPVPESDVIEVSVNLWSAYIEP